jgi:hypothetical protein
MADPAGVDISVIRMDSSKDNDPKKHDKDKYQHGAITFFRVNGNPRVSKKCVRTRFLS